MLRRTLVKAALGMALTLGATGTLQALDYPTRPITLVVPFAPGGGTDVLARMVAKELEAVLPQPVVVDNRPGASGAVGAEYTMRQPADGYTLLFGTSSVLAISPVLHGGAMGHIIDGFSPVSLVARSALILAVPESSKITNLKEYVEASKAKPLTYGTFGVGSTPHLLGALFAKEAGANLVHVPYKGSAPAIADVTGGHIASVFLTVTALTSSLKDGALRGLAVANGKRLVQFPDIPTFAEAGYEGLDDAGWFGIVAPKGVPGEIRAKLAQAIAKVLGDEKVAKAFAAVGVTAEASTPEALQAQWDASVKLVKDILSSTNVSIAK